jgi:hypothetical protein
MPKDGNPLLVALREVYGPLVKQSSKWPPLLAYGLPGIVAVLLITLLRPVVPNNLVWLLAVVILAPLLGYIISDVLARRSPPSDTGRGTRATIDEPRPNQTVIRTIHCNGSATSVQPDMHLWLAVEANGLVWPKEGEVHVDKDRWSATIFEDGATKKFSLALLIANPDADTCIRTWLEEGRRKGEYAEMKGIPGTKRLARVDGLRLRGTSL